jgi:hypothetical protein
VRGLETGAEPESQLKAFLMLFPSLVKKFEEPPPDFGLAAFFAFLGVVDTAGAGDAAAGGAVGAVGAGVDVPDGGSVPAFSAESFETGGVAVSVVPRLVDDGNTPANDSNELNIDVDGSG